MIFHQPLVGAIALLLVGAAPGLAQDQPPPSDADVATIQACLDAPDAKARDCIGRLSGPCMDTPDGGTTIGMGECLATEEAVWDRLLNERYGAAVTAAKVMDRDLADRYEADVFTTLRDAQRAWIAYRDAECDRRFAYWKDGTIRTVEFASCRLNLTADRAIDLAPDDR